MKQNHTRRGFLAAGSAGADGSLLSAAAAAAAETPTISPELSRLLEEHERARERHHMSCGLPDDEGDRLSAADDEAIDALCAYRCRTIEEAYIWAGAISAYVDYLNIIEPAALALRALAGLPAEDAEA